MIALLALMCAAPAAQAEKRIALLIGNQSYGTEIGRLSNPHNDVTLLETTLKGLGFEVVTLRDAGLAGLYQAVNSYARRVQAAGPNAVALFYYSGHGAADGNTNYLIPVDVRTTETGELWDQSLRLTEITRKLKAEAGNATHFVIFDACRNTLKLTRVGSRALVQSKGFVPVSQESGMLIAYATAEGELASDVGAGAGPYAKVLAEEITRPGVEAVVMFRSVQRRVRAEIKQEPYLGFNAMGDIYLAGAASQTEDEITRLRKQIASLELLAKVEKDTSQLEVLALKDEFGRKLEELKRQQVAIASPPPQPKATDEPSKPASTIPLSCDGVQAIVGSERRCLKPKGTFRDCPECPEMVVMPAGAFTMGSNEFDADAKPVHKVMIAKPFAVGKFEVTFAEWDACVVAGGCKHKPEDKGWGRGKRPVINVSWNDAREYVAWLMGNTGRVYGLLTEAEWEYAARAGSEAKYAWGGNIRGLANCNLCGSQWDNKQTAPVGSFSANSFGLNDMHGNVWEWVEDCHQDSYIGAPTDGSARSSSGCSFRTTRGGSWRDVSGILQSASRVRSNPDVRSDDLGFRVARH